MLHRLPWHGCLISPRRAPGGPSRGGCAHWGAPLCRELQFCGCCPPPPPPRLPLGCQGPSLSPRAIASWRRNVSDFRQPCVSHESTLKEKALHKGCNGQQLSADGQVDVSLAGSRQSCAPHGTRLCLPRTCCQALLQQKGRHFAQPQPLAEPLRWPWLEAHTPFCPDHSSLA